MKPLVTLLFLLFAVAAYADQYVSAPVLYSDVPMSEAITILETEERMPSYSASDGVVTSVTGIDHDDTSRTTYQSDTVLPYSVTKPVTVPLPLGPLLPLQEDLPITDTAETIRGQVETVDNLKGILEVPLPPAQGPVDMETIDPKLTKNLASQGLDVDISAIGPESKEAMATDTAKQSNTTVTDPLGYTVLLAAMVITTIGLIYMAFVAYDYRQRWMQSLTVQNDRCLGGGMFDMEMEDSYNSSVSFSEGFGLTRRSSI